MRQSQIIIQKFLFFVICHKLKFTIQSSFIALSCHCHHLHHWNFFIYFFWLVNELIKIGIKWRRKEPKMAIFTKIKEWNSNLFLRIGIAKRSVLVQWPQHKNCSKKISRLVPQNFVFLLRKCLSILLPSPLASLCFLVFKMLNKKVLESISNLL